jgi:restriction system protein
MGLINSNNVFAELGVIAAIVILLLVSWNRWCSRHAFNIRIANKHLKRLAKIEEPGGQFGFLRAVNVYIFEEMILTALKRNGHSVKRNKRYSGDGGIDGKAKILGQNVFIQAKRYKGHVVARDVEAFSNLCHKASVKGLFVHTGRTGKLAKQLQSEHVDIVSGERLLMLLLSKQYKPSWSR